MDKFCPIWEPGFPWEGEGGKIKKGFKGGSPPPFGVSLF